MTLALEDFIQTPFAKQDKNFLKELYENFIVDFQTKLNFLTLAQISIVISKQYSGKFNIQNLEKKKINQKK